MASIEQRPSGKWCVRFRQPGDPRLTRVGSLPDKKAAEALQREIEADVSAGRRWQPRRACPSFAVVAQLYLTWAAPRLAPRTLIERAHQLERFRAWRWPRHKEPAFDIVIEDLEGWSDDIVRQGNGRLYANVCAKAVRTVWAWAAGRTEWRGTVPSPPRLHLPSARPKVRPVAPTWEEMDKIIAACGDSWYRHLYIIERYTGLRSQQALQLRWSDVDLDKAVLHIPADLPGSKSKHEQAGRWVPLAPAAVAELRTWPTPDAPGGWLIDRRIGTRRKSAKVDTRCLNSATISRIWKRAKVRPELRAQPTHGFRKGFRTMLIAAGASSDLVSYLQGRSLGLDGDVYTVWRMLEAQLRAVVALIPAHPPVGGAP